jgi:8-oxo-dGTP pyrophosphatase MutT (NUDIX family)
VRLALLLSHPSILMHENTGSVMGVPSETPRWRPTARLFVLDPLDRLLLFRFRDRDGNVSWLTPGGGLHRGETVQAAAVRELAEETGYAVAEEDLGPIVGTRAGLWRSGSGRLVFAADTYFMVRVAHPDVSTDGHQEVERAIITGLRWWSVAELRGTTEYINPPNTADLVATLIADGPPSHPVRLPWHAA